MTNPSSSFNRLPTAEQAAYQDRQSILIADDHIMLSETLALALSEPPRSFRTEISGTHKQTKMALKSDRPFDLVMLDIRMPGMFGLKSINEIIEAAAPTPVVLLSGNADKTMVLSAVENGARGLIPKTLSIKSVMSVVDLVISGQIFLPAEEYNHSDNVGREGELNLSQREVGVLQLTSEGLTNKEIASAFGSNEAVVKAQMRYICRKLVARNRAHAVSIGRKFNIIE